MARKIKYRIWDKQTKNFITENGHGLHNYSNWSIDVFTGKLIDYVGVIDGDHDSNFIPEVAPEYYFDGIDPIRECRYELQECTHLLDISNNVIYEGDILKYDGLSLTYPFIGVVEFVNCHFSMFEQSSQCRISLGAGLKLKIIGNIFQTPHLLA